MGHARADTQDWIVRQLNEMRGHECCARAIRIVDQEVAERLSQAPSRGVVAVLEQVTSRLLVVTAYEDRRVVHRVRRMQRPVKDHLNDVQRCLVINMTQRPANAASSSVNIRQGRSDCARANA